MVATASSTRQAAAAGVWKEYADPVLPQTINTTGKIRVRSSADLPQSQKHAEAKHVEATAISTGQGEATGGQKVADPTNNVNTTSEIRVRSPADPARPQKHTEEEHVLATAISTRHSEATGGQKVADPIRVQSPADLLQSQKHTEAKHVEATAISAGQATATGVQKDADPVLAQTSNTTSEIPVRSPLDLPQPQKPAEAEHVVATAISTERDTYAAGGVQKQADPVLPQTTNTTGEIPVRSPADLPQSQQHTETEHHVVATASSTRQAAAAGVWKDADPVLPQTTNTTGEIPVRSPAHLDLLQKQTETEHHVVATAISTAQATAVRMQDATDAPHATTATKQPVATSNPVLAETQAESQERHKAPMLMEDMQPVATSIGNGHNTGGGYEQATDPVLATTTSPHGSQTKAANPALALTIPAEIPVNLCSDEVLKQSRAEALHPGELQDPVMLRVAVDDESESDEDAKHHDPAWFEAKIAARSFKSGC